MPQVSWARSVAKRDKFRKGEQDLADPEALERLRTEKIRSKLVLLSHYPDLAYPLC